MQNFTKNEIVWAKLSGYPYWPGTIKSIYYKHKKINQVSDIPEEALTFLVEFFGDHSKGEINEQRIKKFLDKYIEYSQTKKRGLKLSIKEAKEKYIENHKDITTYELFNILGKKRIRKFYNKKNKENTSSNIDNKIKEISNYTNTQKKDIFCVISNPISLDKSSAILSDKNDKQNSSDKEESEEISEDEQNDKKLQNLVDDLFKYKFEVRRKGFYRNSLKDIKLMKELLNSNTQLERLYYVYLFI